VADPSARRKDRAIEDRGTVTACTHYDDAAGECGVTPTRAFLQGPRCATHTPAALAGRGEPGEVVVELVSIERRGRAYGAAKSDPLGRLGWNAQANLPSRANENKKPK
jgi:hypothetical protein